LELVRWSSPEEGGGAVPDVIGTSLPAAKAEVKAAGYHTKVKRGGLFGVVIEENWTVCATDPPAGSPASPGTTVNLVVARSC
jgi:beta-lactam-binding protein with PASTA domain